MFHLCDLQIYYYLTLLYIVNYFRCFDIKTGNVVYNFDPPVVADVVKVCISFFYFVALNIV